MARRKGNKIAPGATTDDYDSTDHAPHPYHMMMDVRGGGSVERKVMGSRGGSRMKHGRSHRGRPFSRDHGRQSTLGVSGRRSRGVAADVQRELAWMDTPGGVQLMRIQVCTRSVTVKTFISLSLSISVAHSSSSCRCCPDLCPSSSSLHRWTVDLRTAPPTS